MSFKGFANKYIKSLETNYFYLQHFTQVTDIAWSKVKYLKRLRTQTQTNVCWNQQFIISLSPPLSSSFVYFCCEFLFFACFSPPLGTFITLTVCHKGLTRFIFHNDQNDTSGPNLVPFFYQDKKYLEYFKKRILRPTFVSFQGGGGWLYLTMSFVLQNTFPPEF